MMILNALASWIIITVMTLGSVANMRPDLLTLYKRSFTIEKGDFLSTVSSDEGYVTDANVPWGMKYEDFIETLSHPRQVNTESPFYNEYDLINTRDGRFSITPFEHIKFEDIACRFSPMYEFDEENKLYTVAYLVEMEPDQTDAYYNLLNSLTTLLLENDQTPEVGGERVMEINKDELKEKQVDVIWFGENGSYLRLYTSYFYGKYQLGLAVGLKDYYRFEQ